MAKTVLLAKVAVPTSINHARPITILSCLYRLFSRFVFRHTASVWKKFLPFPISGRLPIRGAKELAFVQKRSIEDAIESGVELGGFSLDLIKAYNTFGRYAVMQIMAKLGMPRSLLLAWVQSLDRMVRYPCVNGHFTEGVPSTTGVPEGCSISVLSMIATSSVYFFQMSSQHIMPYAYADNWSWMSSQQTTHCEAFRKITLVVKCDLQLTYRRVGTGPLPNRSDHAL